MFFENEREAFETYAKALPNNCIFLVDTYNSRDGIRRAIDVAKQLRKDRHELIGLRLDSGERVALSIEAREQLDAAGFENAKIVCSGDLDEFAITQMKKRGAKIDIWGVGTRLTTGCPDAALNGIYKLGAVRRPGEKWRYRIKLSDESAKTSCPGLLQVRRYSDGHGRFLGDAIYEIDHPMREPAVIVDLAGNLVREVRAGTDGVDLLTPIFRRGEIVYDVTEISASRRRTREQLACLPVEAIRLTEPIGYAVGLEKSLFDLRASLVSRASEHLR